MLAIASADRSKSGTTKLPTLETAADLAETVPEHRGDQGMNGSLQIARLAGTLALLVVPHQASPGAQ